MGQFLTRLKTEQLTEGTLTTKALFQLTAPLIYKSNTLEDTIEVTEGFITDFASVPRLPIVYTFLGNLGNSAATLHDFLYTYPHLPNSKAGCKPVTKEIADRVLQGAIIDGMLKATENEKVSKFKKCVRLLTYRLIGYLFYLGVKIGGKFHWGQEPK